MFPGLARPPLPHAAGASAGLGCGRGLPAARGAGRAAGLVRAGGRGRAGLAPGGPVGFRAGLELEVFYLLLFFNGRARPRPSPKDAEALLGVGAAPRALLACGTTARLRAAILSPRLLSLCGGGRRLALSP